MRAVALLSWVVVGLAGSGCATTAIPPFARPTGADIVPDATRATLVFFWPQGSCDPAGHYVIATGDGAFLGTLGRGTRLRVDVAPGRYTILGWNPPEEQGHGALSSTTVPVLHANLLAQRVYFVRLATGEWDETGPRSVRTLRTGIPLCYSPDHNPSSAWVVQRLGAPTWGPWQATLAELTPLGADTAGGQAWLDAHREDLAAHLPIAEHRYEVLRPLAHEMATIEGTEGVAGAAP